MCIEKSFDTTLDMGSCWGKNPGLKCLIKKKCSAQITKCEGMYDHGYPFQVGNVEKGL